MTDISGQSFKYSGKKYTLQAMLQTEDSVLKAPLNTPQIECFQYETELDSFLVKGSITYADKYGVVDRFLEQQAVLCTVSFIEHEQKFDGEITIEKFSEFRRFECQFLVDNICITGRNSNQISYRIDLVSVNVLKCMRNIQYSNYGSSSQGIFDIFKTCLVQAGLSPDKESFDRVKTGVKLDYITNGNDNMESISKYLMGRMLYYSKQLDDSLKFFFWNETSGQVQLFDLCDTYTATGQSSIVLSLMKTNNESLIQQEPNNVGSITRFPAKDGLAVFFPVEMSNYSYAGNVFEFEKVKSQRLINIFNQSKPGESLNRKVFQLDNTDYGYLKRGSYWNNDISHYYDMRKYLIKNNALLIETSGDILRKTAGIVEVIIDRDIEEIAGDQHKDLDDIMTRYHGLEGMWFISRSHHIIYPQQQKYRQCLALCRNFIPNVENKESS